jgi:hypothetical protein
LIEEWAANGANEERMAQMRGMDMAGLWRNRSDTPEGKYLVTRRDGSIPEWPWFVIGARDPAAVCALRAYADRAEELGMDPEYIADVRAMADEWAESRLGHGDPDAPPHRYDDPATIAKMRRGQSA